MDDRQSPVDAVVHYIQPVKDAYLRLARRAR
jgi:hypothetical protein